MKTINGDIWDFPVTVISTNQIRCSYGLVMGAGNARQAKDRYPELPRIWLEKPGDVSAYKASDGKILIRVPVKYDWKDPADLSLVKKSIHALSKLDIDGPIGIPLIGGGLGRIDPKILIPYMEKHLDNRFVLCLRAQS